MEGTYTFKIDNGSTDFKFGLAVFAALVYRLTGDEDIVIATDESANTRIYCQVKLDTRINFPRARQ